MSVWFKKLANTVDINIQLALFVHANNACVQLNYHYFRNFSTYKAKLKGSISIKKTLSDLMSNHGILTANYRTPVSKRKTDTPAVLQQNPALIYATAKNMSLVQSYDGLQNNNRFCRQKLSRT